MLVVMGLLGLAGVVGGSLLLVSGFDSSTDTARYSQAPGCASGQTTDCRGNEPVTVISWSATKGFRGSNGHRVTIRLPGGADEDVLDEGGDLFPRLQVNQVLRAETWNGQITQLADDEGHLLVSSANPVWKASNNPIAGLFLIVFGGLLLGVTWLLTRGAARKA